MWGGHVLNTEEKEKKEVDGNVTSQSLSSTPAPPVMNISGQEDRNDKLCGGVWHHHEHQRQQTKEKIAKGTKDYDSLERTNEDLLYRIKILEHENGHLKDHVAKLDNYITDLSKELTECRESSCLTHQQVDQWKREVAKSRELRILVHHDLKTLITDLQKMHNTRRSVNKVLDYARNCLKRSREPEVMEDMNKRLISLTASLGSSLSRQDSTAKTASANVSQPPLVRQSILTALNGLMQDMRRVLSNMSGSSASLLDELIIGRRESEILGNALSEAVNKVRKNLSRSSPLASSSGTTTPIVREKPTAAVAIEQKKEVDRLEKLQLLDDMGDETAQMLRGMARTRVSNVEDLLHKATEQQTSFAMEVKRLKTVAHEKHRQAESLEKEVQQNRIDINNLRLQVAENQQAQVDAQNFKNDLDRIQEENASLTIQVKQAERTIESIQHRESDALERLQATQNEVLLLLERLTEEEKKRERMINWTTGYVEMTERRRMLSDVFRAWKIQTDRAVARQARLHIWYKALSRIRKAEAAEEAMTEEIARLRQQLCEADERVAAAVKAREETETENAKWAEERESLAESAAEVLSKQKKRTLMLSALKGWYITTQQRKMRRKEFASYLRQYLLRKKIHIERIHVDSLEAQRKEDESALDAMAREKESARSAWQKELTEVRTQEMEAHQEVGRLQQILEDMRSRWLSPEDYEELKKEKEELSLRVEELKGVVANYEEQVSRLQRVEKELQSVKGVKRHVEKELHQLKKEFDQVISSLANDTGPPLSSSEANAAGSVPPNSSSPRSENVLMWRLQRSETERKTLAGQLVEARNDVRRLSAEVEEMMSTLRSETDDARAHAQYQEGEALLARQLNRAREDNESLENEIQKDRKYIRKLEEHLQHVCQEATSLEWELSVKTVNIEKLEDSIRLLNDQLLKYRCYEKNCQARLNSFARRIAALERERKAVEVRLLQMLDSSEAVPSLALAELTRLQKRLDVSEKDRMEVEERLSEVLGQREELLAICHRLREEILAIVGLEAATTASTPAVISGAATTIADRMNASSGEASPLQDTTHLRRNAQNLQKILRYSQKRVDELLSENTAMKQGLVALENNIVSNVVAGSLKYYRESPSEEEKEEQEEQQQQCHRPAASSKNSTTAKRRQHAKGRSVRQAQGATSMEENGGPLLDRLDELNDVLVRLEESH